MAWSRPIPSRTLTYCPDVSFPLHTNQQPKLFFPSGSLIIALSRKQGNVHHELTGYQTAQPSTERSNQGQRDHCGDLPRRRKSKCRHEGKLQNMCLFTAYVLMGLPGNANPDNVEHPRASNENRNPPTVAELPSHLIHYPRVVGELE